ncbi:DUF6950 family protein [Idiomarina aminovorans]|uniref:DUF6950 family protein n=1 Tax=Idiomarina aminovorans TaxID=2914829 RepID=UPI0020049424|nr:hypothetical protein [Idiomarina sp. ATCH4]MCK7458509.1 hypothetical protein [Idiomarina sp. ATCH4]
MKRTNDWPTELANFLLKTRKTPFKWGENDCCLFAANAIIAMGGQDVAEDVRGRYKTAIGAHRIMKKFGANSLTELLKQRLGRPDGFITRGAIVIVESEGEQVAGVFYQKPWALTEKGLQGMPFESVIQSWSLS